VTIDSSVNVNQIHFSDNIAQYAEIFLASKVNENYTGPEFGTLDEKLQQEFLDLLTGLGINDELGSFIEVVAVDKDQRLHMDWMTNVKNLLI
jgi:complement component 1 Q subcomponent-binding protein, mitochondrial